MAKKLDTQRQSAAARREQLEAERREVTAKILQLEARGAKRDADAGATMHAKALALVSGEPVVDAPDNGAELRRLFDHRESLDRAIEMCRQAELVEQGEHQRQLLQAERSKWEELVRRRVLTALQLQQINREFRAAVGRYGGLPTARFPLLGEGHGGPLDQARGAGEELVRLGLLTQRELDQ